MELDFDAVRALSSPTRLRILSAVLDKDQTPTALAEELDRSKSTVSSHLSTLERAGLVEKDAEEGRRRVTYAPTRKAEAIVKGKERKVKFSLASSAITGIAGVALLGSRLLPSRASYQTAQAESLAMDTGGTAAETAAQEAPGLLTADTALLGLGVLALAAAAAAVLYTLVLHRLPGSNI